MRTQRFVAIYAVTALAALLSLLIAPSVFGATTISTSISTGGNLTVDGTLTIGGSVTIDGAAASTYSIGGSVISGTITIGGASQTGTITFGRSTASNTINIGNADPGAAATQIINIGAGAGAGNTATDATIGIGNGSGTSTVIIGSHQGASALTLQGGTGNVTVNAGGTNRLVITHDTQAITLTGTTTLAGSTTVTTGPFTVPAGTVGAPSIIFTGDPDTGFFASAANTLQLVAGGNAPLQIGTSTTQVGVTITGSTSVSGTVVIAAGTVSAPSIALSGDTDTGIAAGAVANNLTLVAGGYSPFAIGSSTTLSTVTITGTATVSGNVRAGNGLVGNPAFAFDADPDTGIFRSAADELSLVAGGGTMISIGSSTKAITITGTTTLAGSTTVTTGPFTVPTGTVGAPSIIFTGDPDTGLFASAANTLQLVAGGNNPLTIGTSTTQVGVTITGSTSVSGAVVIAAGTAAIPSVAFTGDSNTGIYTTGADNLSITVGGTQRFSASESTQAVTITGTTTLAGSTTVTTGPFTVPTGSVSAPSITFSGDSDTGFFASAANTLQLVAGGYNAIQIGTSSSTLSNVTINGTTTAGSILAGDGVVGNPAYSFSGDPDTGIFRNGANGFQLVAGGKGSLLIGSSTTDLVGVTVSGSTSITGNLTGGTVATNGSTTLDIAGALTTIALCHGNADTDDEPIVDCSGAPSDIAEYYETTNDVEVGDVVATTQNFITYKGVRLEGKGTVVTGKNETLSVLAKSSTPYQSNVIGIVSTAPYQLFGEDVKEASKHPMPIALAGRVPVKATDENGAIRAGDWLTASSKPGYAMKATGAGYVVGIALANFDGQSGKILALVKPGYIGASQFQGGEGLSIQATSGITSLETVEKLTVQKNATIQGRLVVKGNARFDGQIIVGKDTAGMVSLKTGQKTARVDFGTVYKKMPVVTVTPLGNPGGYFWVSDVSEKGFTVNVSKAPSSDLGFNWIAFGSNAGLGEEEVKAKVETAAVGTAQ